MSQSTLYIVSTPIGNLSSFSPQAKSVLENVSFILCEDTRHTLKLLNHFAIKNNLESLHVHNEKNKIDYLMDKLISSETHSAALVSDAGTPAICDPGSYFVAAAHAKNIRIITVPGPCSMTSALSASGFIQPRSLFSGFLSKNKSEQFAEFKLWVSTSPCVAIFFESPRRVCESLKNLHEFFTTQHKITAIHEIELCVSREISKKFEEHRRSSLVHALEYYQEQEELQGEFVICVNLNKLMTLEEAKVTVEFAAKEAVLMSKLHEIPLKVCCKEIAQKHGFQAKEIYSLVIKMDTVWLAQLLGS
ncbi:MAG: 16S rRNA (cytidine(1402)-2'-O)-methyltransferase [Bdellovibrionota bacterium]